ncbi:hypothetical protein RQP46_002744 [Phenoliferia psychrophenolica]
MPISFQPSPEHPWTFEYAATPPTPTVSSDGTHLAFKTLPGTDWWRTTDAWRSTGAAYVLPTGIEFTEGKAWASVVITNRWSDWSLLPIPTDAKLPPLRFSFKLQGHHLRVYLGTVMIREVNGFMVDATPEEKANAQVGVMGCSPKNTKGIEVDVVEEEDGIDNYDLPKTVDVKMQKDIPVALMKGSTVFVNYLAAVAHDVATDRGNKTIGANHVLEAVKQLGWEDDQELIKHLKKELAAFRVTVEQKKSEKSGKPIPVKSGAGPGRPPNAAKAAAAAADKEKASGSGTPPRSRPASLDDGAGSDVADEPYKEGDSDDAAEDVDDESEPEEVEEEGEPEEEGEDEEMVGLEADDAAGPAGSDKDD